jgi:hypothetical protein
VYLQVVFSILVLVDYQAAATLSNKVAGSHTIRHILSTGEKKTQRVRWPPTGNTCCIIPAGFIC